MKKTLTRRLPASLRLRLKLSGLSVIGATVRLVAQVRDLWHRLIDMAIRNGMGINGKSRVQATLGATAIKPFSADDFFLLMEVLDTTSRFPPKTGKDIKASIIIPVFNKVEYTFQCLRSLLHEVDPASSEIIIINNGSTDSTDLLLSNLSSFVRVIHNSENMGFVDGCNQGAAASLGEYLIFLNNDTIVLSGWLENLIETVEAGSAVGAVGSMLIYPDGCIQEAGGIVWKNGDAAHYGWGEDASARKYNFAREVDYCSAASLLVRKDLFNQLGGFDRRYAPAYYEDTDLCFSIRDLGYKVLFQPMSRLIHYEGATAGTDLDTGFKGFQKINRDKFALKWRQTLERCHLENDAGNFEDASNRRQGENILVFDDHVPAPDRDAGSERMLMILKTLATRGRAVFVPLRTPQSTESERLLGKAGIETVSLLEYRKLLKRKKFQLAIFSRPEVAEALIPSVRRISPNTRVIFDTVDVVFQRLEREYRVTGDLKFLEQSKHYRGLEKRLARASDQVWCVTPEEKELLTREVPEAKISVIPTIHPTHGRGRPFDERRGLLFVGLFTHRPNTDAVLFFLKEIYPQIEKAITCVKFYVVGSFAPGEITEYESETVSIVGHVANLKVYLDSCRAFVAPIRFGAGIKGKIGQALSHGLPVITTTIGAEGFGLTSAREAMIADDPKEFAEAVIRTYLDAKVWQNLSDMGYNHVRNSFSPEVIGRRIDQSITELLG